MKQEYKLGPQGDTPAWLLPTWLRGSSLPLAVPSLELPACVCVCVWCVCVWCVCGVCSVYVLCVKWQIKLTDSLPSQSPPLPLLCNPSPDLSPPLLPSSPYPLLPNLPPLTLCCSCAFRMASSTLSSCLPLSSSSAAVSLSCCSFNSCSHLSVSMVMAS